MKTLAVIPARLGATRLPNKPLRLLGGIPLVIRVWERARAMPGIERCVIATDSPEIAEAAKAAGAEAVMTRADHPSGTDRVAEVAAMPAFKGFEAVVNIQGDEPFIPADAVTGSVKRLQSGLFKIGTAAAHASRDILDRPDIVKVVVADDGRAMYFSRAPIPFLRDPSDAELLAGRLLQHIGIYAYTPSALDRCVKLGQRPLERIERLEQLRALEAGMAIGVAILERAGPVGIDTEADLERANEQWEDFAAGRLKWAPA